MLHWESTSHKLNYMSINFYIVMLLWCQDLTMIWGCVEMVVTTISCVDGHCDISGITFISSGQEAAIHLDALHFNTTTFHLVEVLACEIPPLLGSFPPVYSKGWYHYDQYGHYSSHRAYSSDTLPNGVWNNPSCVMTLVCCGVVVWHHSWGASHRQ